LEAAENKETSLTMPFECENISFGYTDAKVVEDFSISFAPGNFYGVIGPNGSGKTTIVDLLSKHLEPEFGRIHYNGKDLSFYSKKQLSKQIALVPQNFYINFAFTVKEIVMMGRYPHIPRFAAPTSEDIYIVNEVMEKTGIDEFADRFITELSAGERQRVVFARALAQNTPVLILDEATSNLDINYSISLLNISEQGVKKEGKTVIAVMQNINLAATYCDYLIFLCGGRIAAHGITREVLNPDTIQSVFNVEAKVYHESYSDSLQVVFKK
jgi:iron complex transport system ATP-binding protein